MKALNLVLILGVATVVSIYSLKAMAETGQDIYESTCIACHGDDGKGAFSSVPDFTKSKGRLSKSNKLLLEHITEGFESEGSQMAMPAKGGNDDLTKEDIKKVLKYIENKFNK